MPVNVRRRGRPSAQPAATAQAAAPVSASKTEPALASITAATSRATTTTQSKSKALSKSASITQNNPSSTLSTSHHPILQIVDGKFGTGCLVCKKEDDEERTLLCEKCDGEYHIYCLTPALTEIPKGQWFCKNCQPGVSEENEDDGMDQLVAALPPKITSRFGEICWAQGGGGYGWWPSIIYDPRLTIEPARAQAKRHLRSRHLVYFYQCPESPFSILPEKSIKPWYLGLTEDMHQGRTAKVHSCQRFGSFQEAFEYACAEIDKPIHSRLDWEHTEAEVPHPLSPKKQLTPQKKKRKVRKDKGKKRISRTRDPSNLARLRDQTDSTRNSDPTNIARTRSTAEIVSQPKIGSRSGSAFSAVARKQETAVTASVTAMQPQASISVAKKLPDAKGKAERDNLKFENNLESVKKKMRTSASSDEEMRHYSPGDNVVIPDQDSVTAEDSEMVCKIILKSKEPLSDQDVGFVILSSLKTSTLADVRKAIVRDIGNDELPSDSGWRFYFPKLGPVSRKQEIGLGVLVEFLTKAASGYVGKGTYTDPVSVFLVSG